MFVHGANINQKIRDTSKYKDNKAKNLLKEINIKYNQWKQDNLNLSDPFITISNKDKNILNKRVELLNNYKILLINKNLQRNLILVQIYIHRSLKSFYISYSRI
jgi:hypothetical protein